MKLFDTATREIRELRPRDGKVFKIYACGPTVYSDAHIGNFATFVRVDFLRRAIALEGKFSQKFVTNITDVGHLTGDDLADAGGEDKLEKAAGKAGQTPRQIADFYLGKFLRDSEKLRLREPDARPRATDFVREIIELTRELLAKNFAYETADGVYFEIAKFPKYGKLSGKNLDDLLAGARVAVDEKKRDPRDFALWKKCVGAHRHHAQSWESPWGRGFPGWHIECSAMARAILGGSIDLHAGAEDLIFPHHECEIAQSETATGEKFCEFWFHPRHILVDGKKMSKSLGNFYTVSDLEKKGFSALDFRFLVLSASWREQLNFSFPALEAAAKTRRRIGEIFAGVGEPGDGGCPLSQKIAAARAEFRAAIFDDLATPRALAALHGAIRDFATDEKNPGARGEMAKFREDFAASFDVLENPKSAEIPDKITELLDARAAARAGKNFAESDRLRDEILAAGWEVRDGVDGQTARKV